MIDQQTIDRIMDAADIVEVVSDFVSLRKRGVNYIGLCPFHDEKTPSFSVSPSKGICKCFSCGKGGTAVHFIMEHEQMSYYEALRYLAKKYNIEIHERELSEKEKAAKSLREEMLLINEYAQNFFVDSMWNTEEGRNIGLAYFYERGFRDDTIKKFGLGYSPEARDALSRKAIKSGYKKELLVNTGLSLENSEHGTITDRFRGRVMFPVYSLSGKIVAFGGRVLRTSDKVAKYVNSPESEIYHKSNTLYGIYQAKSAIVKNDNCFLVEGYTDVLSMHQAGIANVVASSGTSLTLGQIRQIHRFTENIILLYDGDAAGIKASLRGIDLLLEEGINVKVVLLPDGNDPDSFSRKQSAESFANYIREHETDFITFKTRLLLGEAGNDPIRRAALIGDIVRSISVIPDDIARSIYIKECSRMMEMREEVLMQTVSKERIKRAESGAQQKYPPQAVPPHTAADEHPAGDMTPSLHHTEEDGTNQFEAYEYRLVRLVIKYGLTPIYYEGTELQDVITSVVNELEKDEIKLQTPLYDKMLKEAARTSGQYRPADKNELYLFEEIDAQSEKTKISVWKEYVEKLNHNFTRHFLNNPDEEISTAAVDMISEKYRLSRKNTVKSEEERLTSLVRRSITELKDAIITARIKEINAKIKAACNENQHEYMLSLLEELNEYKAIKTLLSKELGERIINPVQ